VENGQKRVLSNDQEWGWSHGEQSVR
jgi:hypothetical protein